MSENIKRRGRPKKIVEINEEVIEEINEPVEFEPLEEIYETDELFLDDLNNENYCEPPSKDELKQNEKELKQQMKIQKRYEVKEKKINSIFETNDLFDDLGTEIIGRDRRVIINKMNQYKSLFPKELAKFKVKKGASVEELHAYLQEMSTIVECSSYDNFLSDSIIQSIKLVEGGSKMTSYDISGCADMLKANSQFNNLLKQLYVKYSVFSKIPPEIQMVLLVSTTAYICVNKNKNKAALNDFLSQPMK